MEKDGFALCSFIDIEGAFDNTNFGAIENALTNRDVNMGLRKWVANILSSRNLTANLGEDKVTVGVSKGCPQGSVISPLLWILVVDGLLYELRVGGLRVHGYADDVCERPDAPWVQNY